MPQGTVIIGGAGAAPGSVRQRGRGTVLIGAHGHQRPRGYLVPGGPKRRTVVCDSDGTTQAFLATAVHGDVTWELNQPDQASITVPYDDPGIETIISTSDPTDWGIEEPMREVTLWRGDDCLTWGTMRDIRANNGRLDVTVPGLLSILSQRFIGFTHQQNLLEPNADFAEGDTGWSLAVIDFSDPQNPLILPADSNPSCYVEVAPHPLSGRLALHIYDGEIHSPFLVPCAWREQKFTAVGYERGIKAAGTCYVEGFVGPNIWEEGISLAGAPLNEPTPLFRNFTIVSGSRLDDSHPVGDEANPERHTTSITIPPATTGKVQFMLKGCKGSTWWEFPICELDGSMAFVNEDVGTIAFKLVDHLAANFDSGFIQAWQNPNYPYSTEGYGKSDLAFETRSNPIGRKRTILHNFASRVNGLSALQELTEGEDSIEFWMEYEPAAGKRTFCTARHKGRYRKDLPLRFGPGSRGNLTSAAWSFTGRDGANSVVMLSSGGAAQPEGSAIDETSFAGGLTLEKVLHAPSEASPTSLDARATFQLQQLLRPVTIAAKLPASPYFERGLRVGDRVPINIQDGPFSVVDAGAWITRMTLTRDDYLELVLQRFPGFF